MRMISQAVVLSAALGFGTVCLSQANPDAAHRWPSKPVRFIVPSPPGGPIDIVIRLLNLRLTEHLGQPIIIENQTAGAGMLGSIRQVARSAPDGYTVLMPTTPFVINMSLFTRPGYDAQRDFAAVAIVASQPNVLFVHPAHPAHNLDGLVAWAKAKPGGLYAAVILGATPHLTAERFLALAGIDLKPVFYKGSAPSAMAVLSGEPSVGVSATSTVMPYVKSGRLRALAVSSTQRIAVLPEVPTFAEAGFPDIVDYTWIGLFYPVGTPDPTVQKLNEAVNHALLDSNVRAQLENFAFAPVGGTPQRAADYVKTEIEKWGRVLRERNIKVE